MAPINKEPTHHQYLSLYTVNANFDHRVLMTDSPSFWCWRCNRSTPALLLLLLFLRPMSCVQVEANLPGHPFDMRSNVKTDYTEDHSIDNICSCIYFSLCLRDNRSRGVITLTFTLNKFDKDECRYANWKPICDFLHDDKVKLPYLSSFTSNSQSKWLRIWPWPLELVKVKSTCQSKTQIWFYFW